MVNLKIVKEVNKLDKDLILNELEKMSDTKQTTILWGLLGIAKAKNIEWIFSFLQSEIERYKQVKR